LDKSRFLRTEASDSLDGLFCIVDVRLHVLEITAALPPIEYLRGELEVSCSRCELLGLRWKGSRQAIASRFGDST